MQNVNVTVNGNKMTITVKLDAETTPSKSGKTEVIATTRGNEAIATPKGNVILGLNLYRKS